MRASQAVHARAGANRRKKAARGNTPSECGRKHSPGSVMQISDGKLTTIDAAKVVADAAETINRVRAVVKM